MNAEELARALAARFLEEGNYEALGLPLGQQGGEAFTTAAAEGVLDEFFQPEEGFAGLAVQSVGYTKGAERESVVIYVTTGSQKALKALPNEVGGVPVAGPRDRQAARRPCSSQGDFASGALFRAAGADRVRQFLCSEPGAIRWDSGRSSHARESNPRAFQQSYLRRVQPHADWDADTRSRDRGRPAQSPGAIGGLRIRNHGGVAKRRARVGDAHDG